MPIQRFWLMHSCINRISAEREMRLLRVHTVAAQGNNEMHEECRKALVIELGEVVKSPPQIDQELDEEGWRDLKNMV